MNEPEEDEANEQTDELESEDLAIDVEKSIKIIAELKYVAITHVILNCVVLAGWVLADVLYLQEFITLNVAVNPFELALYTFNLLYIAYMIWHINLPKVHRLTKNLLDSCIESALMCLAILVVFYALKQGITKSADQILYYLNDAGTIKQIETRLMEVVLVFPAFICTYLIVLLYQCIKMYNGVVYINSQLEEGSTLSEVAKFEDQAAEANNY